MHRRERILPLGTLVLIAAAGCTSASTTSGADAAAASSSDAQVAAASSAATAAPGEYGEPVVPDAPDPTDVATDAPVTVTPGAPIDVVITYSGWDEATSAVEVGAYAAGVAQDGGTCQLTLTSGDRSVSAAGTAETDATSTTCAPLRVAGSDLATGTWTAVVGYESSSARGSSAPVEVVVP